MAIWKMLAATGTFDGGTLTVLGDFTLDTSIDTDTGTLRPDNEIIVPASAATREIAGHIIVGQSGGHTLAAFNVAEGSADIDLDVSAVLSDIFPSSGNFTTTKIGPGTMRISGSEANTFDRTAIRVSEGTLVLAHSVSDGAIPTGKLVIGDSGSTPGLDIVRYQADEQIAAASGADVSINSFGVLDLNGFTDSISNLVLRGGTVDLGGGTLAFTRLTVLEPNSTVMGPGTVDLGGTGFRDLFIHHDLEIEATLSNGGFEKNSAGTLTLSGSEANSLTHTSSIRGGVVVLNKSVTDGGIQQEIRVGNASTGDGGELRLGASEQILAAPGVLVDVAGTGLFNLNGFDESIQDLELNRGGTVTTDGGTLSIAGQIDVNRFSSSTTSASISGNLDLNGTSTLIDINRQSAADIDLDLSATVSNGGISKTGDGTLALTGANIYSGGTSIDGGTLLANNTAGSATGSGDVVINTDGTLGGTGEVSGLVTANSGGTVSPGMSAGVLTIEDVQLNVGSTFLVEIGGLTPGSEYDVLMVGDSVDLGGNLAVQLIDLGGGVFTPDAGDRFDILIANDLTGTFDNVANGGRLNTLDGMGSFLVSYDETSDTVELSSFFSGLAGDYNDDGAVNVDDYTTWRNNVGSSAGTLPNDADGGVIGQAQYETWKANFGSTTSGSPSEAVVPEPASALLLIVTIVAVMPYSNKSRGMRKQAEAEASAESPTEDASSATAARCSQTWAMLIKRVDEVDPLKWDLRW